MDMPGRGHDLQPTGSTWDVATQYGGGIDVTVGPGSVAVHGSLAAFGEVHRRDGRLPWADVVAPALDVARQGFLLTPASRYYLDFVHDDIFGWDPASRSALHGPDGKVTTGPVTLPDLAAYVPVVRPSLVTRIGGWSLATTPPPSVGGVCLTAMLRLMDGRPHGVWEEPDVEHLVRVQRAVLGHRLDVLDRTTDLETAAAEYLRLVDRDHVAVLESGSTAHVSATDRSGEACSVTFSSGYGSGMVADGTGIWLNNCLGEQELHPLGLYGAAPGTRLLSNMAPTVARHDDGSTLAIGSPGADRITTAIVQVLAGFTSGLPLQEAVDHPRVHVHRPGRPDEVVRREVEPAMYFGGVGATLCDGDGRLTAAADPRREGAVRLVEG
jgi:gamma-glutamyltranspeptidase/glutathione hydrolase